MPGSAAGDEAVKLILWLGGALVVLFIVDGLFAKRQGIQHKLGMFVRSYLVFIGVFLLLPRVGLSQREAFLAGLLAGAVLILQTPKRSRHIPAKVKREVIARYERETGKKYNRRKDHIDHFWSFAGGGSNTTDNLRVIPKKENLRKRDKPPSFWDWLR